MRQTIAEKILSSHTSKKARSGDIVIADVDLSFAQDVSGGSVIDSFGRLNSEKVLDKDKFCFVFDHAAPSPDISAASVHDKVRKFARPRDIKLFDIGSGVSFQVLTEQGLASCGDLVLGAEPYAGALGAFNIFGISVGPTDIAIAMASGKCWLQVPETISVEITGETPKGVYPKDVMLHIMKTIGANGANDKVIEFSGEYVRSLSLSGRMVLSGMSTEAGAVCGLMKADKKTMDWMKKFAVKEPGPCEPDDDARYFDTLEYEISSLTPQVAFPHSPDNVKDIEDAVGTPVDQVVIGAGTDGRFDDIEIAASILKGRQVADGVKCVVTPASSAVYLEALKKGLVEILVKAGAIVNNPGCGPADGIHQGVLADGEVALSTANSNVKGKMANSDAFIYLGSPATAAASALEGSIADPRAHKRRL